MAKVWQLMELNRKFSFGSLEREEVVALTQTGKERLGLKRFKDMK
jgi:hypothetical protein